MPNVKRALMQQDQIHDDGEGPITTPLWPCSNPAVRAALRKSLPYLLLIFCSGLYLYPFMRLVRMRTDEGTLIYGAVRVIEGQVPFRDFFEVMGPGTFYWLSLFCKLFGTTWFATRVSLMCTSVVSIVLMYRLSRRLQSGFDLVPAALIMATSVGLLWPAISHHGDSNLFALVSFSTFLWWMDSRRPVVLLAAGLLAGVTTCFLQPKGVFLFLSLLIVLWFLARRDFWSSAGWLSAGYLLAGGTVLSWFWAAGALPGLIDANVVFPLTKYNGTNSVPYGTGLVAFYWSRWTVPLVSVFNAPIAYAAGSVLIFPFLVIASLPLVLTAFAFQFRRRAFNGLTLPYWIVGAALWFSEIHRKDIMHLVYGSPVLVILLFHLFGYIRPRWGVKALQLITVCTVVLALFNSAIILAANTKVVTRRGTVRMYREDAVLEFLNANTTPGEEVFAYPYGPMYYFLADIKNPTRFSFLLYDFNADSQFLEAVHQLEESKVRYVLWDKSQEDESIKWAFPQGWSFRQRRQIMEPYLLEHYRLVRDVNGVRILARKEEEPFSSIFDKAVVRR